ncbi:hypothetical protein C0J52_13454 [Blattella germanica]|nr:hypothetical protein C0J52_13454 [Blattella germanica]
MRLIAYTSDIQPEDGMACEARPPVFAYSMRVEWLGLDGRTEVNNSMRVEWSGVDFGDHRALCEVEDTTIPVPEPRVVPSTSLNVTDSLAHTARCFLHVLLLIALIFVLGRGAGLRVFRVPFEPHAWDIDPLVCDWRYVDPPRPCLRPRRCISAGPVLQGG